MTRKFGLILCFFCFGFAVFGQNEDCPIALDLVTELDPTASSIDLSVGYTLKVDTLTGPGELDNVVTTCLNPVDSDGNAFPYGNLEDRSFWFSFKAATAGTFEMLITPDGLAGDFDFAIWEGSCPSNPCSIPLFCGWFGSFDDNYVPTGVSPAPNLVGLERAQIWDPINIKENTNYFVLIDHKENLFDPTLPYPNIGCEIIFGGTAVIEPTKQEPDLVPIIPATTEDVPACRGTSITFQVALLNSEEDVDFIWESPSGNVDTTSIGERDFLIEQSGQVCVEIECPIQKVVCWEVVLNETPNLNNLTPIITDCIPLTIEDYIEDRNNTPGFFELLDLNFNEIDESFLNIQGDYLVRKVNGACGVTRPITTTPPNPELIFNGNGIGNRYGTCDGPSFDLSQINSQIVDENGHNTGIQFYEDSLQAVDGTNEIITANGFKTYWAKGITINDCFDIIPIEVFDASPTIATIPTQQACMELDLSSVDIINNDGTIYNQSQITYFANQADVDDPSLALPTSIINTSGFYYAQIVINPTCATTEEINVIINQNPSINPIDDIPFCQEYNLEDATIVEANGTILTTSFFNSEADANDTTTDLSIPSIVNAAGTYWIKGTDPASNCSSIVPITLNNNEPSINSVLAIEECGDTYDLNTIRPILSEATGAILDYSFYETIEEAEAGTSMGINTVTTSGIYHVRGEDPALNNCFDVQSITLTLTMPNISVRPNVVKIEDGEYDLSDPIIRDLDSGQSLVATGYYSDSLLTQALPSPIVTVQDTYWVAITVGTCPIRRPIIVRPESDATFQPQTLGREFPCVKEDGVDVSQLLPATTVDNFDIAFFNNEEDAEKSINAIADTDLIIFEEGSIWVRTNDTTDSNIFGLIELTITERAVAEGGILSMDKETCQEDILSFQFTGAAPFEVRYTDGIDTFDISIPSTDVFEETVSPTVETTYEIVSLKDRHDCDGLLMSNEPTYTPVALNFTDPVTECNNQETFYTVSFKILGGDLPSINIDGNGITGTIVDSLFTSDLIPITEGYSFIISDRNHSTTGDCSPSIIADPDPPVCTCDTEAAEMDQRTIDACVGETVTAIIDQEAVLADNNDRTVYVLHESDTEELRNIIATNNAPEFTITPDLAGGRYYISAVSTRAADLLQTPELQVSENRCLTVAIGTPVDVRAIPTVNLSLEKETSCFGEAVELTFELPDTGPFNLSFFDGNMTMDLTNVRNGDTRSVSAETATTFEVTSISYSNLSTCINDTLDATTTLDIFEPISIQNRMENCEEDGENFTVSFEIIGGDPTSYSVNGSTANINGNVFTSDRIPNQTNYNFEVSDANGCSPIEVSNFGKCDCTSDITTNIEILQEISCADESDGVVKVNGVNGELPYSFEWGNGTTTEQLSGLGAGWVYVSMTDGNLCEVIDSIELTSPEPITATVSTNNPSCADLENGSIIINNVQGGTRPYTYSINGQATKTVGLFANLPGQDYGIVVEDAQGCLLEDSATINIPTPLNIWFDQSSYNLVFGDSLLLRVNGSEDSLRYAWQNHPSLSCTNCSNPIVRPTETTNYSVTVTNKNDCTISRDILVEVDNDKSLYSPTAFSPNGDGVNDTFGLFGGNQVREIVRMQIFNRWGTLLYSRTNLPTTDNFENGWDGNETNGDKAPNGIYIYVAEIIYTDGTSEIVTGDVALMR